MLQFLDIFQKILGPYDLFFFVSLGRKNERNEEEKEKNYEGTPKSAREDEAKNGHSW